MILSKLKVVSVILLACGALAAGVVAGTAALTEGVTVANEPAKPPAATSAKPPAAAAKPQAADDKDSIAYSGRVLGPDGKPVPGAKLHLTMAMGYLMRPSPLPESATTGPDGRFQFTVPKAQFGDQFNVVAATSANRGTGWVQIPFNGKRQDLTLRLVDDDVAIRGQIVDLEGKPIPGATLRVLQISAAPGEDLGPWLEAVKAKKGHSGNLALQYLKGYTTPESAKVTTDAQGRFRLSGIGRNRLVIAQLDGPAIASQEVRILTWPGNTLEATDSEGRPEHNEPRRVTTYYGASFRYVAAPSRPIVGVVRDKDTKKPLAGVAIRGTLANNPRFFLDDPAILQPKSDAEGRYRLTSMPKGDGTKIKITPRPDMPYVAAQAAVPNSPGLDPVTVDFELKRGVWIEGKITDKVTGRPLQGHVVYFSLYSNPNLRDYPGVKGWPTSSAAVKEDGSYRVAGLPGPGMVGVQGLKNHYLRLSEREDEYGIKGLSEEECPEHLRGSSCNALTRINPAKGVGSVKRDVTLDPGWKIKGTVLGPDGKPLAGARRSLVRRPWWDGEAAKAAEFTDWFNPHAPFDILFQHLEKGLIGVAQAPRENGGAVTVRLERGAAVTGRLVGADGKPRAGVELQVSFRPKRFAGWLDYSPELIKTDREGRFRVEALLPGYTFRLSDGKYGLPFDGALHSDQTKDLGDVQMKALEE